MFGNTRFDGGEPGVGKSRLCACLTHLVRSDGGQEWLIRSKSVATSDPSGRVNRMMSPLAVFSNRQ